LNAELDRRLAALMRRAQAGDRQAYEALLFEVAALLRSFVRARIRQQDAVQDIVQETLLSIHADRHTYDPARPFGPWLYAIARHRLLDFVRKQERRTRREAQAGAMYAHALAPAPLLAADFLHRALALLSKTQRETIELLKFDGWSVAEVAQRTGLSESAVKVTAHRGYKNLRRLIASPSDEE
jgi:RNA polymerase sigma-70 factor, ECF subfamily